MHNSLGDHRRRPLGNPVPNRGPTMADMGYQPGNKRVRPCGQSLGKGPGNLPCPYSASPKCETSRGGTACAGEQEATPPARTQDQGPLHGAGPSHQWGLTTPGTPEYKGPTKPRGLSCGSRRGLRALYLQTRGLCQMKSQIKH